MVRRVALAFVALTLLLALRAPEGWGDPDTERSPAVGAETWEAVRAHVLPSKGEKAWCGVPWRASLWGAVIDAHRAEKPILLWAMNGHPLACT